VSVPQRSPGAATGPVDGDARLTDSVTIAIARDPSLVRTVRLVAAAVARRAAVHEAMIEEIRLAVGEACAVMIGIDEADLAADTHSSDQVVVRLTLDEGLDASIEGRVADLSSDLAGLDLNPWALLQGLSDQLTVQDGGGRTTVSMSWPLTVTGP
jgi:anti-sigma regulatory factor (Ser/Thr protein kinase)